MTNRTVIEQQASPVRKDRLGLKLLGLFFGIFLLVFLALLAFGVLGSLMESRAAGEDVVLQPPPVNVDANIENELAKVLAFSEAPAPGDVRDPFVDRGGISDLSAAGAASSAQNGTSANATSGTTATAAATTGSNSGSAPGQSGASAQAAPPPSPVEATKRRYEAWLERARYSPDAVLDPRVFSVEDLQPVGIVDGGNGAQEILFYSEALEKTLSFPVGTLFFDGWLSGLRPEGVVFSFNDSRRTVRMRSWVRSLRASS